MTDAIDENLEPGEKGKGVQQGDTTQAGQEFVPPKDGSWVPVTRLNEVLSSKSQVEQEMAELRGEVATLKKSAETPREYSRAELGQFVENGQMSQPEADTIFEQQAVRRIEANVTQTVSEGLKQSQAATQVQSDVAAYKAAAPEVMQAGSQERLRLEQEYQFLVGRGYAADQATELLALRAVYGPVERMQRGRPEIPETHQETGGVGGQSAEGANQDGTPKGLSASEKAYYADGISKGIYADWNAVEAELKYANKGLRKRMGARA